MGLFGMFKSNKPKLEKFGVTEALCPYCDEKLAKLPGRKKKCPNCEKYIFVRTRPLDQKKILIREDQFDKVKEQNAIKNGTYKEYLAEKERYRRRREKLNRKLGYEPSESEIEWDSLLWEYETQLTAHKWGLFRNVRLNMCKNLQGRGELKEALKTMCEVCYIDINGPTNHGVDDDPILNEMFSEWNPHFSFFDKGSIPFMTYKLAKEADISEDELSEMFVEVSKQFKTQNRTPIDVEEARQIFMNAIANEKDNE